jgi:uncharacterized protein YbcI
MVGLLSRYTGRGATSAWTTIAQDLVVCVLGDALTKGEKTLVKHGNGDAVLDLRKAYQESMADEAIHAIEELTGRRVAAFMSNNHIDPDLGVEIFVLQPDGNGDSNGAADRRVRGGRGRDGRGRDGRGRDARVPDGRLPDGRVRLH